MGNYFSFDTYLVLYNTLEEEDRDLASAFAGHFENVNGNYYVRDENAYCSWLTSFIDDDTLLNDFLAWSHTQGGLSTQWSYGS